MITTSVKRRARVRAKRSRHWIRILLATAYFISFGFLYLILPCKDVYVDMKAEYALNKTKTLLRLAARLRIEEEAGSGCHIPRVRSLLKNTALMNVSRITCPGRDWVTCEWNECFVLQHILDELKAVECSYRDIVFVNDYEHYTTFPIKLNDRQRYTLEKSDHVKISCVQKTFRPFQTFRPRWSGLKAGLRKVSLKVNRTRMNSPDVLILCLRSLSHNDVLLGLPRTHKFLTEQLGAVVLNGYNVVGDGSAAALFPILTGKTALELDAVLEKDELNPKCFLFGQLHSDGYRTAYFDDVASLSTFRLNFQRQPTDHYLRAFFLEQSETPGKHRVNTRDCLAAIHTHSQLINLTHQFSHIRGKHFSITIIPEISFNANLKLPATVDNEILHMIRSMKAGGRLENTLLIIMSDHGPKLPGAMASHQGAISKRLPFVSIVLPNRLKKARPKTEVYLWANADVLTTPFDIHATVLDVVGLKQLNNNYKVAGSDLPRGMSLVAPIPVFRSCAEADVLPHWCACYKWTPVPPNEPSFAEAAQAVADLIHDRTAQDVRCAKRTVASIEWVMRYDSEEHRTLDNLINSSIRLYQARLIMRPGRAIFEGTVTLLKKLRSYVITEQDISRIDSFSDEATCVSPNRPHLSKYCYCNVSSLH